MRKWQGFYYPSVGGRDIVHELYLTSLGRITYPAKTTYPAAGHPPEYQFRWKEGRVLGDFALVWIEQGRGEAETSTFGRRSLSPGDLLFLAPGEWHRYRPDPASGWTERWICANGAYLHRLRRNGSFPSTSDVRQPNDAKALAAAFDQLRGAAERNSLLVSGLTLTVFALALGEDGEGSKNVVARTTSGDASVDAAIHHIWTNCHRPLHVNDIAKHLGISRRTLERKFAETGQRSVANELTHARVMRGRELLCDSRLTVKEAGYAAGFGGAPRFIAAHRRVHGTTPGRSRTNAVMLERARREPAAGFVR